MNAKDQGMKYRFSSILRIASVTFGIALASLMHDASAVTPHQDDGRRLIEAVRSDRIDVVRRLVMSGADIDASVRGDGTALIVAAKRGDLAIVNALISLGADVNHSSRGDGNPLIAASAMGHFDVIERLVAAGAKVNTVVPDDETALINAVRSGHLKAVESLVGHGADVNLEVFANGNQWRSPLNQARKPAIRKYLIAKGAVPGHAR